MTERREFVAGVIAPLLVFVVFVVAWTAVVELTGTKKYVLPTPGEILSAAVRIRGELLAATWLTARAAVTGFGLSIVCGTLIAIVFSQSRWTRLGCFPYAVLLQTVPIVAVAPLIIAWRGPGFQSIVFVSFVVSLFPIVANATAGLTSVDRGIRDWFRLHHASRWQVVTKLQLPHAIPQLVTGARTSAGLAVIGAIVGEFFAGNSTLQHGLGFMVPQRIHWMKTDEAFAAVVAAVLLGMGMFAVVGLLRNTLLARWCWD